MVLTYTEMRHRARKADVVVVVFWSVKTTTLIHRIYNNRMKLLHASAYHDEYNMFASKVMYLRKHTEREL